MRCLIPLATLLALFPLAACGTGTTPTPGTAALPSFASAVFDGRPIDNPYLPLIPGTTRTYQKDTDEGTELVLVEVLAITRIVLGVSCTVVRDRVYLDGELIEDTHDWYAQDTQGNVWYMGEEVEDYEGGVLVSTAGSWEAGVDGAAAGILMLANPIVGLTYKQEYYAGEAEDMATVKALDGTATVPFGSYVGCLVTEDFTPLEPGVLEDKYYAMGVGPVLEVDEDGGRLELVGLTAP